MTEIAEDYTIDELMATAMSKQIEDGEIAVCGVAQPLALTSILLAHKTHAPDSSIIYMDCFLSLGELDDPTHEVTMNTLLDPEKARKAKYGSLTEMGMLDFMERGKTDIQFLRPAQIDRNGNVNITVLGDYDDPKLHFPGNAAIPGVVLQHKKIVLYEPRHLKRHFVDKLDFLTGVGHPEDGEWRKRKKIHGGGPQKVVTNLCVMNFDDRGRMRLESIHPNSSIEEVQENTSFDLIIPEEVPTTDPPSKEVLKRLREEVDPSGYRKGEF